VEETTAADLHYSFTIAYSKHDGRCNLGHAEMKYASKKRAAKKDRRNREERGGDKKRWRKGDTGEEKGDAGVMYICRLKSKSLYLHRMQNNESSKVCGHLLPVTYLI